MDRRQFMATSAAAVLATGAVSRTSMASVPEAAMMNSPQMQVPDLPSEGPPLSAGCHAQWLVGAMGA